MCSEEEFSEEEEDEEEKAEDARAVRELVKEGSEAVSYTHLTLPTILRV